jgi:methyl-accepting chemotaxis protein
MFGKAMQLHFHLPPARSLVRLWARSRPSAREVGGISDDLSASVRRNAGQRRGKPLRASRSAAEASPSGIAPSRTRGQQLGSVETSILRVVIDGAASGEGLSMEVYMYAENSPWPRSCRPGQEPVVAGSSCCARRGQARRSLVTQFLLAGQIGTAYRRFGEVAWRPSRF